MVENGFHDWSEFVDKKSRERGRNVWGWKIFGVGEGSNLERERVRENW